MLFQDVSENLDPEAVEESGAESLFELIFQGGPLGIIIVVSLIAMSILALYIFAERYQTLNKAGQIDQGFIQQIKSHVMGGNIAAAKALCANTDTPAARMVEKGIMRLGRPTKDIEAAIENVGNLELFKLEKNLPTLASIAGVAPMVGFFGTVTGMIMAFYKMSTEQNITPDVLAGGIYQALITTAFGLFVGILALIGYNLLVAKINKVVFKMEATTVEFIDLLQEPDPVR